MGRIPEKLIGKIRRNIRLIRDDLREFPASREGDYLPHREQAIPLSHIFNWTQSFFPGMALWAYLDTGDEDFLKWALCFKGQYEDKVFRAPMETMHDLGFLYSPYAVMLYEITGDETFKAMAIRAADALAMRFIPRGQFIRAWGRMDDVIPDYIDPTLAKNCFFRESTGLAIVDSMMNLPLLFRASVWTGHPFYRRVAMAHADTTLRFFLREDHSVCHAYRFSEETGEPLGEANYCGYSNGSHWARGTAWAIYGFALAYGYTGETRYLDAAGRLLDKFMRECGEGLPAWDFRLPPGEARNPDSSAAAIALCGVMELQKKIERPALEAFKRRLRGWLEPCVDEDETRMGLLREQNGLHTYAPYGDYFLVESMMKEASDIRVW